MKVVILCGGRGTRLREETEYRPKPLVEIGNKPILWHIMKIYSSFGFKDFILCLGYKGEMIKDYFLKYEAMNNNFTIKLGSSQNIKFHSNHQEKDWTITLVDTGLTSNTGARIKKVEKYIDTDLFMITYGDGVADINIKKLLQSHQAHGTIGTVTGVHPSSRFGELMVRDKEVVEFTEKPQTQTGFINGGFFVFHRGFFGYLSSDDNCSLEGEPVKKLTKDKQLSVYLHKGFWQCMDTQRELDLLNELWKTGKAPWKIWKD